MFRRKKVKPETRSAASLISDKAAVRIAGVFMRVQHAFAGFMNRKTKQFSARVWKLLIIVFAAGWSSISIFIIRNAFTTKPALFKSGRIQFIIKPARNDSLAFIEEIYELRKNGQVRQLQQEQDSIKGKNK